MEGAAPARGWGRCKAGLWSSLPRPPVPSPTSPACFFSPQEIMSLKDSLQNNFSSSFLLPLPVPAGGCGQKMLLIPELLSAAPRLGWQLPQSGRQPSLKDPMALGEAGYSTPPPSTLDELLLGAEWHVGRPGGRQASRSTSRCCWALCGTELGAARGYWTPCGTGPGTARFLRTLPSAAGQCVGHCTVLPNPARFCRGVRQRLGAGNARCRRVPHARGSSLVQPTTAAQALPSAAHCSGRKEPLPSRWQV